MKVFLLEGPDGAGKSTTANQLADLYDGKIIHFGPPAQDNVWAEYGHPIYYAHLDALMAGRGALIIDRAHVSELVYGPLFRGKIAGKRYQWRALEQLLNQLGTQRLYVSPGWKTVQTRFTERGDDFVKIHQLQQIHRAYHKLLGNHPDWFRIDNAGQRLLGVLS